jgi:hypothetical protein
MAGTPLSESHPLLDPDPEPPDPEPLPDPELPLEDEPEAEPDDAPELDPDVPDEPDEPEVPEDEPVPEPELPEPLPPLPLLVPFWSPAFPQPGGRTRRSPRLMATVSKRKLRIRGPYSGVLSRVYEPARPRGLAGSRARGLGGGAEETLPIWVT